MGVHVLNVSHEFMLRFRFMRGASTSECAGCSFFGENTSGPDGAAKFSKAAAVWL
ncbi:hypothetical protein [Streptomyces fructofermentans]|uniref:hypothetical protein n=1 Tax=Streptomyces fructofermentans TaxID=152141 RepID=UPI0033EA8E1A